MRLYHYTCQHAAAVITRRGMLRPQRHPLLAAKLIWLTNQGNPDRIGLGLESQMLACDRLAVRYFVNDARAEPWPAWASRQGISSYVRACLETDRQPEHWFVLDHATLGVQDRAWRLPNAHRIIQNSCMVLNQ